MSKDTSKTLVEIVQDHKSLDQLLLEAGGELTDEQTEQIIDNWMAEIRSDLSSKADNYEYRKSSLETAADTLKARAKMISTAAKTLENMADSLKSRMKSAMMELGTNEIIGNDFRFKLTGSKPSMEIDMTLLPAEYTNERIIIEPNREMIKERIDSGVEVPGIRMIQGHTLRVTANKKLKGI